MFSEDQISVPELQSGFLLWLWSSFLLWIIRLSQSFQQHLWMCPIIWPSAKAQSRKVSVREKLRKSASSCPVMRPAPWSFYVWCVFYMWPSLQLVPSPLTILLAYICVWLSLTRWNNWKMWLVKMCRSRQALYWALNSSSPETNTANIWASTARPGWCWTHISTGTRPVWVRVKLSKMHHLSG